MTPTERTGHEEDKEESIYESWQRTANEHTPMTLTAAEESYFMEMAVAEKRAKALKFILSNNGLEVIRHE